jgi:hypothetical protein
MAIFLRERAYPLFICSILMSPSFTERQPRKTSPDDAPRMSGLEFLSDIQSGIDGGVDGGIDSS